MSTAKSRRTREILLVLGCIMMTFIGIGLGSQPKGLYVAPVSETLGIQRSVYSTAGSVSAFAMVFLNTMIGPIKQKIGSFRRMVAMGFVIVSGALLLASTGTSMMTFHIYQVLIALGASCCATVTINGLVSNWFEKNQGLLFGLIFAGSGLGGSVFSYLTGIWINNYGWRTSFRISAVIVAASAAVVLLLVRDYPKWHTPSKEQLASEAAEKKPGMDISILKEKNFYLLAIPCILMGGSFLVVSVNASTRIIDAGFDIVTASGIASVMFFANAVGKTVMGGVSDRFGAKTAMTILMACGFTGVACLLFASNIIVLYGYAVFFGLSFASTALLSQMFVPIAFPHRDRSVMLGMSASLSGIGTIIGSPLMNLFYESTGSYTVILGIYLTGIATMFILLGRIEKPSPELGTLPAAVADPVPEIPA